MYNRPVLPRTAVYFKAVLQAEAVQYSTVQLLLNMPPSLWRVAAFKKVLCRREGL